MKEKREMSEEMLIGLLRTSDHFIRPPKRWTVQECSYNDPNRDGYLTTIGGSYQSPDQIPIRIVKEHKIPVRAVKEYKFK